MFLFVDTETSDLPKRWDAPASDTGNWPHIIQLAWVVCDADGNPGTPQSRLIKPNGFSIARSAFERHGISNEFAQANGVDLAPVLDEFVQALTDVTAIVAHNVSFDANVLGSELIRAGLRNVIDDKSLRCTMKEATDYCKLPGRIQGKYKWPSLTELHTILFGEAFDDAHDATADCLACMRCFLSLRERNAIA